MRYVDGFVLPVPTKNLSAYRELSQKAGRIWMEHGALEYRECVGDDLNVPMGTTFPVTLNLKKGESVVFAWIVYKSRAHRDRVNALVMKDPRLSEGMDTKKMPFDMARMVFGGFEVLVDFEAGKTPVGKEAVGKKAAATRAVRRGKKKARKDSRQDNRSGR